MAPGDAIVVRGIRAKGCHGIGGEREDPQPFVVDVELGRDLGPVAAADDLDKTIDYTVVVREVRRVVGEESFELIEALADAIAARVLLLGAAFVRVRVSKPRVAPLLDAEEVAVVVERSTD